MVIDHDDNREMSRGAIRRHALAEIIVYGTLFTLGMMVSDAFAYWALACSIVTSTQRYREACR